MTGLRIREAARVVVLDEADRVLLTRFEFRDGTVVWTTVGGGLEPGETYEAAARRELLEEAGLMQELGPCIWTRDHRIPDPIDFDVQRERIYLVRTPTFEPQPALSWTDLNAEGMTAVRWWTIDEVVAAENVRFGPRALGRLLRELVEHGPSAEPVDVGD